MSLIGSLLGLAIFPLKAKRPEPPPKEVENLAVMALADEVRRLQFALDFWRERGNALMAENERLRNEFFALRREKAQEAWSQRQGQQMAAQNLYNQGLAQVDMTSPNYHAQLAQAYQAVGYCTCVPARAQALGVHPAEPLPR